jgi:4-hydroxy-tetrahydrodipicolinate reductase
MTQQKIKIIVNGAFGKMGTLACEALSHHEHFEIIAKLSRKDDLSTSLQQFPADVVLDLTQADCVWDNVRIYQKFPIKFVIGTSGLHAEQIKEIQEHCLQKKQGAAIIPNFSIGAVMNMHFAQLSAKWFDSVDIIEMHHEQKLDSPSGTAIRTAQLIHEVKSQWPAMKSNPQPGRETYVHQIPIHSVRMPGILAVQQVMFGQAGETITLSHQTIDRKAYMPGVLLACEKVMTNTHLIVGLEHWLFENQ